MSNIGTKQEEINDRVLTHAVGAKARMAEPHEYIVALEQALIRSELKKQNLRRENRRLNEQVKNNRSVYLASAILFDECVALRELVERETDENRDTDPAPPEAEPVTVHNTPQESYQEWDLRTRYSSGGPRYV